jgi:hypothetical protein
MSDAPNLEKPRTAGLLLVPAAGAVLLAFSRGGAAAGVSALIACACLAALLARASAGSLDARVSEAAGVAAVAALPGLLTIYFAFNAGGFFPETPAFIAVVLVLILVVRVTTARDPFAGFSRPLAMAAGGLGLLCVWTLLSGIWSDAPARALIEFDRSFVYLLALVLFGSLPRNEETLRWMVSGLALAIVVIATAAFLSRTLPDVFPTEPSLSVGRVGYPLTYWNTLGLLCALGAILCLHLSSSLREPLPIRVGSAAALPVLAGTVLLTFSRGAIVAGLVALATYILLGRPRGLLSAALAGVVPVAIAMKLAYDATLLAGEDPTSQAATDQGHELALAVAACCLGAAVLRLFLEPLDLRLKRVELQPRTARMVLAVASLALLVAAIALDAPGRLNDQYHAFVDTRKVAEDEETRDRLTDPANTGRIDHWNVALDGFREAKLRGNGAGTYGHLWMANRPKTTRLTVDDAHSLYFETLQELGVVGLFLLVVTLSAMLAAFAPIRRGGQRSLYGALAAIGIAWAVHAGIDWDWETPAVSIWFFCLGGAALAVRTGEASPDPRPASGARVALGAILLAGAIAPALILVSQRQLDEAAAAFARGDCATARERAGAAIRTLELRPEPYEVLGLCNVREGFDRAGAAALERAVERDPKNWEFHYALALARGSAGLDPRPAAREALRRNPHDRLTRSLVRYVDTDDRRKWVAKTRPIAENERLSVVH